jgi:hypothetical protein
VLERASTYVAAARAGIELAFTTSSACTLDEIARRIDHVLCECALTELFLPIMHDPKAIRSQLIKEKEPLVESCAEAREKLTKSKQGLADTLLEVRRI